MLKFTITLEDGTSKTFSYEDKEAVIYFCDKFPFTTYNGPVVRAKSLQDAKVKYLYISVHDNDNDIPF